MPPVFLPFEVEMAVMKKLLLRWLPALLAIFGVVAAAGLWVMRSGLPQRDGELRLAGLHAPVEVRWDRYGVPHLKGGSGRDLALALGFLHANDRMTQLELGRRAAAGRLAEVFGPGAVQMDAEARMLRLREAAEATLNRVGPESRAWFDAYAAGVNAWLERRGDDLPPTLKLFGIRPEPWTPVDSLGFVFLMARDLSFWQGRPEEMRFEWLRRFGPERTQDLLGEKDAHLPPAIVAMAEAERARDTGRPGNGSVPAPDLAHGSNNWAVGLSRSAEGLPLLANDLHLPMQLPGLWYQAHFRAPDYEVMGITLPGVPGVIVGQNRDLAWALTNVMMDDSDLFFEELDPAGERVRRGDGWAPVTTERVEIPVRWARPVPLTLQTSDRGPLLPAEPTRGLPPRSLTWTAYLQDDPLAAFLHLGRARRVADIPAGIGGFVAPAQNLVAADRAGSLLHVLLGRMPRRLQGDGRLPAPGHDAAYGWDGLRDASENPRRAPADDALVTANDDIRPTAAAGPLTADFDGPARAKRIRELLGQKPRWLAADFAAMQGDAVSRFARELVALGEGTYVGSAALAYDALVRWDGRMGVDGASALFTLFEKRLAEAIFGDELDVAQVSGPVRREWLVRILRGGMNAAWFDDVATPEVETRETILAKALAESWDEGVERWGEDVSRWEYGELHRLTLRHPLGMLPVVGRLFNRGPFPVGGSATTIAAFPLPGPGKAARVNEGPTVRWVAVAGDGDRSLAVLPGGQSGHPLDPHYDDQLDLYLRGATHPVTWSEEAIAAATVSTLKLHP
ncbi:penicillin acylase family protein [Aromatoleum sp.]|uniref:penicillin acylase family protein n=1 Tax=Aromatoleum sp. TaxID=2307007 RepID=UPI002FC9D953